ncbi:hypothetical protein AMJ40_03845 [candidate division TA06 bacterium DG_26]|uniref:Metal-binding protein n=1 Tax=candidate division TA06 bacterium DG_26 TaxID=1703771 RepID=A0A0S7WIY2_UNCT6|nr:MAG: hypothetical protein AMJ40_03845 [candidate division TA06 bacterium DG_26]
MRVVGTRLTAVSEWVSCQYGCAAYGTCLTCPPYSPPPQTTTDMLKEYSQGLLLTFGNLSYRDELWPKAFRNVRELAYELEKFAFLDGYSKAFAMGAGPCSLCDACDVTRACRISSKVRPLMEARGIDVYRTVSNCGFTLNVVRSMRDLCTYLALPLIE